MNNKIQQLSMECKIDFQNSNYKNDKSMFDEVECTHFNKNESIILHNQFKPVKIIEFNEELSQVLFNNSYSTYNMIYFIDKINFSVKLTITNAYIDSVYDGETKYGFLDDIIPYKKDKNPQFLMIFIANLIKNGCFSFNCNTSRATLTFQIVTIQDIKVYEEILLSLKKSISNPQKKNSKLIKPDKDNTELLEKTLGHQIIEKLNKLHESLKKMESKYDNEFTILREEVIMLRSKETEV